MKRSLVIVNQYIGSPEHGMEYRHYYLARHLVDLGYRVTLVSGSYSHLFTRPPKVGERFTRETIDGIEYLWVDVPRYPSSKSFGRLWNMIVFAWRIRGLRFSGNPHILVSSPSLFPIRTARKWAKNFRSKLLFEVRDIWPLSLVELSGISRHNPLVRWMEGCETFAYRHANRVISLLPRAREYFVSRGMDPEKFVYLPNGVETEEPGSRCRSLPPSLDAVLPRDKFIVAYTGTLGIANNLEYLLEGAEALRDEEDIHFVLLGQGGEKERLQSQARERGLSNVTFLDAVPRETVGAFLERVDAAFISLLPEKLFRFGVSPNKLFEYMNAKRPVIWAVEAGNNPVEEAECGYSVPLGDISKLREAILRLKALSPQERETLGQNGYNFLREHHTYRKLAEKLAEIIEE
jgi:glycosyltransferase involved in cell wall biosynthesis